MSTVDHTPGRLSYLPQGEANSYALILTGGRWLMTCLHNGVELTEKQRANVQRLAACWNACESLTTEQVELIDGLMPAKLAYQVMQRDRELLLKELKHAVHFFDQINGDDVARYKAVIAKVESSAP